MRRRHRQRRVDGAREGMNQVGPLDVVQPERRRAADAEVALAGRDLAGLAALDLGTVDTDMAPSAHRERRRDAAEVDGIATAARRLATNGAVAALIGNGGMAFHSEGDRPAPAGAGKRHRHLRLRQECCVWSVSWSLVIGSPRSRP